MSLKKMEQRVRSERSRDRKENAHGHQTTHSGVDVERRGTRRARTLDASAHDGAGVGTASSTRLGVRAWPHEYSGRTRVVSDQADRRQVARRATRSVPESHAALMVASGDGV